jgi:predicted ATPase
LFTEIRLRNFKCYADSGPIPLRPLTVLVGPNNAGKSTILQAILMLKQTYEDRDPSEALVTSGPYVDLGGYFDILRGGEEARSRRISIYLRGDPGLRPIREISARGATRELPIGDRLEVSFSFDRRKNEINLVHSLIAVGKDPLIEVRRRGKLLEAVSLPAIIKQHTEVSLVHFMPTLQPRGVPPKDRKRVDRVLSEVASTQAQTHVWEHIFEETRHIMPLRAAIPRYNILGEMAPSEVGAGGENLLRVLRNEEKVEGTQSTLLDLVEKALRNQFHMLQRIRFKRMDPAGILRSLLGDEFRGFRGVNVANMGAGISQVLPILVGAVSTPSGGVLLIEQPEIHLHPRAQADLVDTLIDALRRRGRRQFIVETHSEHLLLRVRRRIAEGKLEPSQVGVIFVEKSGVSSKVRFLEPTSRGHFNDWPEGFFDTGYAEALALVEAGSHNVKSAR